MPFVAKGEFFARFCLIMKNLHSPRRFFTNLRDAVELPNLIEVQKDSYQWFLKEGLRELFDEISPLKDFTGRIWSFILRIIIYPIRNLTKKQRA